MSKNNISNLYTPIFLLSFVTSKDAYKNEAKNKVSSRKRVYVLNNKLVAWLTSLTFETSILVQKFSYVLNQVETVCT